MANLQDEAYYLDYYQTAKQMIYILGPVMNKLQIELKYTYNGKQYVNPSLRDEPAIALYNCAAKLSGESSLSALTRAQAYLNASVGLGGANWDDMKVLASALAAARQEAEFLVRLQEVTQGKGAAQGQGGAEAAPPQPALAPPALPEQPNAQAPPMPAMPALPALPQLPELPQLPALPDPLAEEKSDHQDVQIPPVQTSPALPDGESEVAGSEQPADEPSSPRLAPADDEPLVLSSVREGPGDAVPDKVSFEPGALSQEQLNALVNAAQQTAHAYKMAHKQLRQNAAASQHGDNAGAQRQLAPLLKQNSERYRALSKYLLCLSLRHVSPQYAQMVAEQALKEADRQHVDAAVLQGLEQASVADAGLEYSRLMQPDRELLRICEPDLAQIACRYMPRNYAQVLQQTFEKCRRFFDEKRNQQQRQRAEFDAKAAQVREYLERSGRELVAPTAGLRTFPLMCQRLLESPEGGAGERERASPQTVQQLQDLNAQAKQIYDYLAKLVQTDQQNRATYTPQRWDSRGFEQGVYQLMQGVVQQAEQVQKSILLAQQQEHGAPAGPPCDGAAQALVDGVRRVLAGATAAELLARKQPYLAGLDEELREALRAVDAALAGYCGGAVDVHTAEDFERFVGRHDIQLDFPERADDAAVRQNADAVKRAVRALEPDLDAQRAADARLTRVFEAAGDANLRFAEALFGAAAAELEAAANAFYGNSLARGAQDPRQVAAAAAGLLARLQAQAQAASQQYAQQVQAQWQAFATGQSGVLKIGLSLE